MINGNLEVVKFDIAIPAVTDQEDVIKQMIAEQEQIRLQSTKSPQPGTSKSSDKNGK